MSYKPYLIFLSLIGLGLAVIFIVSSGYYPILSVEGQFISMRTFWKNYKAGSLYYQNILKTYEGEINTDELTSPEEIKLSILTQLIENKLIEIEIKKDLGSDLAGIVNKKIENLSGDKTLREAAKVVYGLNLADFEKQVLVPMANQEILTGELFLKGEKIESWLDSKKKSSRIKIFSRDFYWENGEVKTR